MSRICRNMEDSGKHRFHGLEHYSKMPLFTTYSHTSTLRGYEASAKILQQKNTSEERKAGEREWKSPANSGIDSLESYHFRRLAREKEPEKSENGKYANEAPGGGEGGKVKEKTREQNPKRSQKCTRTCYVRSPTRARGMDIVPQPHPAGATSKPGGELPGKSPQKN